MDFWAVVLLLIVFIISMIISFVLGASSTLSAINKVEKRYEDSQPTTHIFNTNK